MGTPSPNLPGPSVIPQPHAQNDLRYKQSSSLDSGATENPPEQPTSSRRRSALAPTSSQEPAHHTNPSKPVIVNRSWSGLIEFIKEQRPLLAKALENAVYPVFPSEDSADWQILFSTEASYFKEQLSSKLYTDDLLKLTKEYFGRPLKPAIELKEGIQSPAALKQQAIEQKESQIKKSALDHPLIKEAKALFGGELGPIELNLKSPSDPHSSNGGLH
jgi:hypothetical protein